MNLLLDTHVFLWWQQDKGRIKPHVGDAIDAADRVYVSVVSAWEAAIKISLGRLRLQVAFERGVIQSGFEPLLITFAHAAAFETLPALHGDPFDRMLVAQAAAEQLTLVTVDRRIMKYRLPFLDAR